MSDCYFSILMRTRTTNSSQKLPNSWFDPMMKNPAERRSSAMLKKRC